MNLCLTHIISIHQLHALRVNFIFLKMQFFSFNLLDILLLKHTVLLMVNSTFLAKQECWFCPVYVWICLV